MILPISDIKKIYKKYVVIYTVFTIFLALFGLIYSIFDRGITSFYMKYNFIYCLIFGVIVYCLLYKFVKFYNSKINKLYNLSIFTVSIGSILKGIFDISGIDSRYPKYYFLVALTLFIIAFVYLLCIIFRGEYEKNI